MTAELLGQLHRANPFSLLATGLAVCLVAHLTSRSCACGLKLLQACTAPTGRAPATNWFELVAGDCEGDDDLWLLVIGAKHKQEKSRWKRNQPNSRGNCVKKSPARALARKTLVMWSMLSTPYC